VTRYCSIVAVLVLSSGLIAANQDDALSAAQHATALPTVRARLQTLSLSGRWEKSIGALRVTGTFRVDWQFPDKFVRSEVQSVSGSTAALINRRFGFNGTSLINSIEVGGNDSSTSDKRLRDTDALVHAAYSECTRWLVGQIAISCSGLMAPFAPAGLAHFTDGEAEMVSSILPDKTKTDVFLDTISHTPMLVRWKGAPVRITGRGVTDPASRPGRGQRTEPDVDHQLRFAERRDVDGVSIATRVIHTVDGAVYEDFQVDDARVNQSLSHRLFESSRD